MFISLLTFYIILINHINLIRFANLGFKDLFMYNLKLNFIINEYRYTSKYWYKSMI